MTAELKPCPWCGEPCVEDAFSTLYVVTHKPTCWVVIGYLQDRVEYITERGEKAWNRRADSNDRPNPA